MRKELKQKLENLTDPGLLDRILKVQVVQLSTKKVHYIKRG